MNFLSINNSTITISRSVLWVIAVGFVLLLGVILFEDYINQTLVAEAATPQVTAVVPTPQATAPTISPAMSDIQMILNNPANFRVVPKDLMPAQAIIEGKTTKFLMGF